jgi:hypothetical protein
MTSSLGRHPSTMATSGWLHTTISPTTSFNRRSPLARVFGGLVQSDAVRYNVVGSNFAAQPGSNGCFVILGVELFLLLGNILLTTCATMSRGQRARAALTAFACHFWGSISIGRLSSITIRRCHSIGLIIVQCRPNHDLQCLVIVPQLALKLLHGSPRRPLDGFPKIGDTLTESFHVDSGGGGLGFGSARKILRFELFGSIGGHACSSLRRSLTHDRTFRAWLVTRIVFHTTDCLVFRPG